MPTSDALQQAAGFLRAGQPQAACPVLAEFLKKNPKSEIGWLMLSYAVQDPKLQQDCVERVLRINPNNAQAQARRREISAAPAGVWGEVETAASPAVLQADEAPAVPLPHQTRPADPVPPFVPGSIIEAELEETPGFSFDFGAAEMDEPPWLNADEAIPPPSFPYRPEVEAAPAPSESLKPPPEPPIQKPAAPASPPRKPASKNRLLLLLAPVFLCLLGCIGIWIAADYLSLQTPILSEPPRLPSNPRPVSQGSSPGSSFPTLPPTWTPTPTPTITPTPLPSATPTLPSPNPTAAAQILRIEQEVADLRGLSIQTRVPQYLVDREQARELLSDMVLTEDYRQQLEDEARVLSTLGFIKPTYDLVNYALNGMVDNLGGVYVPWKKEIYVLGLRFGGMEHYIYAHEFNHALIDQHFDIAGMGVYPDCVGDSERCAAIRALVEGDATLMASQWLLQYATPQDYRDLMSTIPPAQALPEQFPPPFVLQDLNFPYEYGAAFVEDLYEQGRWAAVNQAYANPPVSTEQILHPAKYRMGEMPLVVADLPLEGALGPGWRLLADDTLGEWMTFLLLQYGADLQAQIGEAEAWDAAEGWGGDHYQVYGSDETGQTAAAIHWVWDSAQDAAQFERAMSRHLHERFRGARIERSGADCWEANGQATCLFSRDRLTLWLLAPDQPTIESVLTLFPDFQ